METAILMTASERARSFDILSSFFFPFLFFLKSGCKGMDVVACIEYGLMMAFLFYAVDDYLVRGVWCMMDGWMGGSEDVVSDYN